MKPSLPLAALVALILFVPRSEASEMRDELRVDASHYSLLRTRFGNYGYQPRQTLVLEAAGLRLRLPGGSADVPQTGLYSYFALAGDCEATLTYEWLQVTPPRGGYGSGIGLAFDLAGGGRGSIQRVIRPGEGHGYVLQTAPGDWGGKLKEVDGFVPTGCMRGRLGLRRFQSELIFLGADAPEEPLRELARLPFTERTIRSVRVFADLGGSPTALDVRVSNLEIHAAEIAAGVPRREQKGWNWGWLGAVVLMAGGAIGFWVWRTRRRKGETARQRR